MASGNFKLKIKINPINQILKRHGLQNDGKVNLFLRNEVERYSDPYIPMLAQGTGSGNLKNTKSHPNNHSIKYNSPYSRYQYHGKVMVGKAPKKVTNKNLKYNGAPRRGAKWDKRMWNDRGKEICKNIKNFIKKGGT